jgi:hypothetical protein
MVNSLQVILGESSLELKSRVPSTAESMEQARDARERNCPGWK